MIIHRDAFRDIVDRAVKDQKDYERNTLGYWANSSLLQGMIDIRDAIDRGEKIEIVGE